MKITEIAGKDLEKTMCGRFYIDDETVQEIEKIVRKIGSKMAKTGDVHPILEYKTMRILTKFYNII